MTIAMLALLDPGDEILIPEPCFVSYGPTARFAGGVVVNVPTYAEHGFQVTADAIARRITPRTKALFLGYPNNPTGAVLKRETMEAIAAVVREHDLFVLSDEIYDRLVYGEAYRARTRIGAVHRRALGAHDSTRRLFEELRDDGGGE